jgi:sugar O-acyltransferase (sialic acid O-acetyltransferase NeuD family)
MKEKVLIGAGGVAREIRAHMDSFQMKCFVDDDYFRPNEDSIYQLSNFDPSTMEAIIAVGDPNQKKAISKRMPVGTEYFSFIHPSAQLLGGDIVIGRGGFISANCILTTNIRLGEHAYLNRSSMIGHDCLIGGFFTMSPGAVISGNCNIGECVYVGANASLKEEVEVCSNVIIGLQAGVCHNIYESGVYVGCPAKKIA